MTLLVTIALMYAAGGLAMGLFVAGGNGSARNRTLTNGDVLFAAAMGLVWPLVVCFALTVLTWQYLRGRLH